MLDTGKIFLPLLASSIQHLASVLEQLQLLENVSHLDDGQRCSLTFVAVF